MHLPEIDKYAHLDSPLHRWDARVKVATLTVLLLATVLTRTWPAAIAGLGVALVAVGLSRIPPKFLFVHLRWVLLFCALLLIVVPLTAGGEPTWRLGPVAVSGQGLAQAGLVTVRANAAVLLLLVTMGTARFTVTLAALRQLRVPRVAVQILAFAYRYIFVLLDELSRMLSAARARGSEEASLGRLLHNTGSMVGMLFVRSFDRTDRVYHAMLARGYQGEVRTLDDFRLRAADVLKGSAAVGVAGVLLWAGVIA
ncbi:MAG: cobalt ECF transporter T component CbiQ [Candidatus Brocadiaceae bacterium]|jgi:cobalt/nickel transport system permease protein